MGCSRVVLLLGLLLVAVGGRAADEELGRNSFPKGFVFGTASASYQYEGAWNVDGKGLSTWDTFTHQHPEKIADRSTGAVADDQYHRYKEDVQLMKDLGMDAYRMSISWPRILPNGSLSGGVNKAGVEHYKAVFDELLSKGIQPYVTLFHWDLPQALEDQYQGFLSHRLVEDFTNFAEVCFAEFGDRVKHWITFNEPYTFCTMGYANGAIAPGHSNAPGTEPYTACHNLLLAHASAARLYKRKFQPLQKGIIGVTLNSVWYIPASPSRANDNAQGRALDFTMGWFLDPLTHGEYPLSMRSIVKNRLPQFTREQSVAIRGSFDFIGLNYYTTYYAESVPPSNGPETNYNLDVQASLSGVRNGVPIGPQGSPTSWLYIYPPGIREVLLWVKRAYHNPVIYITENGVDQPNNETQPLEVSLKDDIRVKYYSDHLHYLNRAIREGVDVRGYFAWTLLDDFEWNGGYTSRLGIHYVDFKNGLKRYPKSSAHWFKQFLTRRS